MINVEFAGAAIPLSDLEIKAAADRLRCPRVVIDAVCEVESSGDGFLSDRRPKILFEAHIFGRLTGHRWTRSHPGISAPVWDHSLYGPAGAHQYERLHEAIQLDRFAALQSPSWGRFQILGINYRMVGYDDIEKFVQALCDSEANHLEVFLRFCEARGLNDALRTQDWEKFALSFNGPGQVPYYAAALRTAFARHSAASGGPEQPVLHLSARDPAVHRLQELLSQAGHHLKPDGIFGQSTLNAVRQFQADHGLVPDGVVGARTWNALTAG
jgi:hypothetical protein